MSRATDEWCGKTDDAPVPARVKDRIVKDVTLRRTETKAGKDIGGYPSLRCHPSVRASVHAYVYWLRDGEKPSVKRSAGHG